MRRQTKRSRPSYPADPVVEEVRRARDAIWREAGGTFEGLLEYLDKHVPVKPPRKPRHRR